MTAEVKGVHRIEVEWEDSTILHTGWQKLEEARRDRDVTIVRSIGFLIANDKRGIVLAASVHGGEVAGTTYIPRGVIRKVRRR